ncbi:MAG: ABC transporter permease [Acidimicrobiales bacterium]|nr:ABC transporter permease [Acidimicrobiales bacterium]
MSDLTVPSYEATGLDRFRWALADTVTITWRNLVSMKRVPQVLVFSFIQPIVFVLLFRYVFGGAIDPGASFTGIPYVDFLMPGIFVQTITFASIQTGVGMAEDISKGLIERFRSLPMARSAVLGARTLATWSATCSCSPRWRWSASPSGSGCTPTSRRSCLPC